MLVNQAVRVLLAAVMMWEGSEGATSAAVKLCGRQLSEIMSRVCHAYNSPSWDVPTGMDPPNRTLTIIKEIVVEQPGAVARRKRQLGIADECCVIGCTWDQLTEYCSISANSESPLEELQAHIIADRSAEAGPGAGGEGVKAGAAAVSRETRREARGRTRGFGRARRPRCWCRKRRSGRRRTSLMGNMKPQSIGTSARAAPLVGTISPLITWGRTLNTDLSSTAERDRHAYVVYT